MGKRLLPVIVGLSVVILVLLSIERRGVERGNRLHRRGESTEAAALYRRRILGGSTAGALHYNLGTTLLRLDDVDATQYELSLGVETPEAEVNTRSLYNLGVWNLRIALGSGDTDSTRAHAQAAVEANRLALRSAPDNFDAKWNLAMAQRMLDSIDAVGRRSGREEADGPIDADALVRSDNMGDGREGELRDEVTMEGEDETLAETEDGTPLSFSDAEEIVGAVPLGAASILRKLLGLESRARWGRQLGRTGRRW